MTENPGGTPPSSWPPPPPLPPTWQQGPWQARTGPPGTVQAAAIITYVCCGLAVLLTLFFLAMAALVGSIVLRDFGTGDRAEMVALALGSGAVSLGSSALACWFARQTWRRKSWGRVGLAGCSALALVLSVLTFGPHTVVIAPAAVAVVVLLFVPTTNEWFRGTSVPSYPQA
ncbi:MAG: hypothetical protein J7518_10820 [Nocardioidaceae bacterium]|nr:hypothetical protein [Nocardioidaceae bacterium]